MAIAMGVKKSSYFGRMTLLKKLFWLYFILLIFEGSLRKWVAPQLSGPLLVIRDPVSLWIVWEAYRTNKWPMRWSAVTVLLTAGMVGLFVIQTIAGVNPWFAGLYGLRSYLLMYPVMFILGETLDEEDMRKLGRFTMWLIPFETVLEIAQYVTPSGSFVNRGAYEGGTQIGFVGTHVRASGTFSFNVGSENLAALAAVFIMYGMVKKGFAPRWLLGVSAFALLLSIPMIGARGLVFQLAGMFACMGIGAAMGISQFARTLRILVPVLAVSLLVSLLPVFQDASSSLGARFAGAENTAEGSPLHTLVYRLITPIVSTMESTDLDSSWIGIGLGRSAIAVQAFMSGETVSVAGEDNFGREIAEMGPIGGPVYALFRLFLAVALFAAALARAREHEPLALLLASLALTSLIFDSPEQTTLQGFLVVSVALMIAASRKPVNSVEPAMIHPLLRRQELLRQRLHRNNPGSRRLRP